MRRYHIHDKHQTLKKKKNGQYNSQNFKLLFHKNIVFPDTSIINLITYNWSLELDDLNIYKKCTKLHKNIKNKLIL